MMIDVPRQTLREIVAKYGRSVCQDPKRCKALLRDFCGAHRREINVLVGALEERVGEELLAARDGRSTTPREVLLSRLTKRLEDNLALTEAAARWAVDSWALALGVLSAAEVEAREKVATEGNLRKDNERVELLVKKQVENSASGNPQTETKLKEEPDALPEQPRVRIISSPPPPAPVAVAPRKAVPISAKKSAPPPQPTPVTVDPPRRRRRGKLRGCVLGCFLIIVLTLLAILGVYVVIPILRDEQQQQTPIQPPSQTTR